jgi:hypothetical protein
MNVVCWSLAESNDAGCNVRFSRVEGTRGQTEGSLVADFVAKVGCDRGCRSAISLGGDGVWSRDPDPLYATFTLRKAWSMSGRRSRNQRCEPPAAKKLPRGRQ